METTVNERLNLMVERFEKGRKAAFARTVGLSAQGVQGMLTGRQSEPSFEVLTRILNSYPQVSTDWLVFGRGEMMKGQQPEGAGLNSSEATIKYATELASYEPMREVINGQAKTIATLENALTTKDELISYLKEELGKFGSSLEAAWHGVKPVGPHASMLQPA